MNVLEMLGLVWIVSVTAVTVAAAVSVLLSRWRGRRLTVDRYATGCHATLADRLRDRETSDG